MTIVEDYLSIEECVPRHIYRLKSRNLILGVWNPEDKGFIGIRTKFGKRYLFTEYHYDTGAPYGTAKPLEDLGKLEDDHIRLITNYPTTCYYCGDGVRRIPEDAQFGGEWVHNSFSVSCPKTTPYSFKYTPLFKVIERALKTLEEELPI